MIFGDYALVEKRVDEQEERFEEFKNRYLHSTTRSSSCPSPAVVLEIGAGRVVSSIRHYGETLGLEGSGLIRINPSTSECEEMELPDHSGELASKYIPLDKKANDALQAICVELGL
jgi:hypothetical protein